MSNYTKLTAYDTKDALTTGDPLKRIKGTELDDEFDAIATAIATKANSASPTFTGTTVINTLSLVSDLAVTDGGTGSSTASGARSNLSAAASGANSDITSLTGLTTALTVPQGGTGAASFTSGSLLKGAGTSAVAVASASDIVTAIGSTAVAKATSLANSSGSAPTYGARAWATLTIPSNGGAVTIQANGNIASVSHVSAGIFYVTFSTAMPDADYSVNISCGMAIGNSSAPLVQLFSTGLVGNYTAPTASGFYFITMHSGNLSVQDCARICITVFR